MKSPKVLTLLGLVLFLVDTSVAQMNGFSSALFPMPEALKPNVEFWKNIYAVYSEREVVIHDSEDLNVVYEVVHLDNLFRGVNVSTRLQWKKIERIKKEYASVLLSLSRRRNLSLEILEGKERAIASLFGKDLSSTRLRRAARNVRGQNGLRERFRQGLARSGLYMNKMRKIFLAEGLPVELLTLPHVESSFNYKAYSKVGAAGLWQFTRSTGRMYMSINYTVDERLDPIKATLCAAKHLKNNYRVLDSWPLAITAYNHGLNGMKRAKRKFGDDIGTVVRSYKSRSFGFASRNFYSEFLAAAYVVQHYRDYFGEIEFYKPRDYVEFETPDFVSAKTLLKQLNLTQEEFAEFNPALRSPVLQSKRRIPRYFKIRVPYRDDLDVEALYAQIAPEQKFDQQFRPEWHKVRPGEGLGAIARRYRVPLRDLMDLNNIRNAHIIYAGQNLQIPSAGSTRRPSPRIVLHTQPPKQLADASLSKTADRATVVDAPPVPPSLPIAPPENNRTIGAPSKIEVRSVAADIERARIRKRGEGVEAKELSLVEVEQVKTEIASLEYDIDLALPNYYVELTRDMNTRVVRIPHNESDHHAFRELDFPENGQVEIEPEETLGHFADWLGVSTQKVRTINRLAYEQQIRIGQHLLLTFESVTPEEFHRRRLEYHQAIEEDFYRNFTIEGEKPFKIRRGDSIWDLCNRVFDMPYWLVKKYNPQKDLLRLVAADELVIPIVEPRVPSD